MLVDVTVHHLFEHAVELAEVAEDDMAAEVPCEALGIDDGRRVTARKRVALEERPVVMTDPLELPRTGEAAWTSADDRYPRVR